MSIECPKPLIKIKIKSMTKLNRLTALCYPLLIIIHCSSASDMKLIKSIRNERSIMCFLNNGKVKKVVS